MKSRNEIIEAHSKMVSDSSWRCTDAAGVAEELSEMAFDLVQATERSTVREGKQEILQQASKVSELSNRILSRSRDLSLRVAMHVIMIERANSYAESDLEDYLRGQIDYCCPEESTALRSQLNCLTDSARRLQRVLKTSLEVNLQSERIREAIAREELERTFHNPNDSQQDV